MLLGGADARTTIYELTSESIIFLLRVLLLAVLYLFLLAIVRAIRHDVGQTAPVERTLAGGRLVVLDPGATRLRPGDELQLQPVTRLGRSARSTIMLDDSFVSAEHATIALRDGTWWLPDRDRTNGTAVNDRLVHGEVALATGDVIEIGDIRLKVVA